MNAIREEGDRYYMQQSLLACLPAWAVEKAQRIVEKSASDGLKGATMWMATSTALALAATASAAGGSYYNTQQTAKRQDNQAALGIQNQSRIQKEADAKVNDEVNKLKGSNSSDEAQTRLDDYLNVLRSKKVQSEGGLDPSVGSSAFRTDAGSAATGVNDYAARTAGLMSRIDAPQMQRQGEAFSYGNLGTDVGILGRQSQGQSFIDQLRLSAIRRNAKIDFASSLLGATGGAAAGGAFSGGGGGSALPTASGAGPAASAAFGGQAGIAAAPGFGGLYNFPSYYKIKG